MGLKDDYYIKPADYQTIKYYTEKYHYLHRAPLSSYSFVIHEISNGRLGDIVGVITYGKSCSPHLSKGICGEDEANEVAELTRLWTEDSSPKNMESYFIANTLKKVDEDIIVSFADPGAGHQGYVYQATNWIYTGLSKKRPMRVVEGENIHDRSLWNKPKEDLKEKYGDKFKTKDRPRKHRYVYFNCNRRRKKELKKKLNYPIKEYPKG